MAPSLITIEHLYITLSPNGNLARARFLPRAQTCTFQGPGASNTTKIPRRDPHEREERKKMVAEKGEKKREILGTHPTGGPTLQEATPFGAPLLFAHHGRREGGGGRFWPGPNRMGLSRARPPTAPNPLLSISSGGCDQILVVSCVVFP